MKLIHVYRIYKYIKAGDSEGLKEYSKSLRPEDVKGLRIQGTLTFRIVSILARLWLRGKQVDKGDTRPSKHNRYYNEKVTSRELLAFNKEVMDSQKNWNVLDLLDHKKGMYIAVEKKSGLFDGFEDSLQWNTYYCTALIKTLPFVAKEQRQEYVDTINALLEGISLCVKDNAVVRHPLENIKYDLEPISQDMVSGLLQLLLRTRVEAEEFPKLLEIKDKVAKVFKATDYCLMYPDGTVNSYDLKPSFLYNHSKAFAYVGLRMLTGEYNDKDRVIVQQMLRIMPYPGTNKPQDRSMYGAIVAANSLEAIVSYDRRLLLDAIDWLQYQVNTSHELNGELLSILAGMYRMQGYKTLMEDYSTLTVASISSMIDVGVKKPGNMKVDPVKGSHPRPPILRGTEDWLWQRKAYSTGISNHKETNMVEFSGPLSRILPVVHYGE